VCDHADLLIFQETQSLRGWRGLDKVEAHGLGRSEGGRSWGLRWSRRKGTDRVLAEDWLHGRTSLAGRASKQVFVLGGAVPWNRKEYSPSKFGGVPPRMSSEKGGGCRAEMGDRSAVCGRRPADLAKKVERETGDKGRCTYCAKPKESLARTKCTVYREGLFVRKKPGPRSADRTEGEKVYKMREGEAIHTRTVKGGKKSIRAGVLFVGQASGEGGWWEGRI